MALTHADMADSAIHGNDSDTPSRKKDPPTFLELPKEVHLAIASQLDISSAISLACTSKSIHAITLPRIWRDLNFSLQPHFGERPSSCLNIDTEHPAEAYRRLKKKDHECREVANAQVETVIELGDAHAMLDRVENLRIEQRLGVNSTYVYLSSLIRRKVKRLEIVSAMDQKTYGVTPTFPNTIYGQLHDFNHGLTGSPFSSLAVLKVTLGPCDYSGFIATITNYAPKLHTLRIAIPNRDVFDTRLEPRADFVCPTIRALPQLKHLGYDISGSCHLPLPLIWILQRALHLKTLSVSNDSLMTGGGSGILANDGTSFSEAVRSLKELTELIWKWDGSRTFCEMVACSRFESLTTLVITEAIEYCSAERIECVHIPHLPTLKTIFFRTMCDSERDGLLASSCKGLYETFCNLDTGICGIRSSVIEHLEATPNLEHIYFFDGDRSITFPIEADDDMRSCHIRSFKHAQQELLSIHSLTYSLRASLGNPIPPDLIRCLEQYGIVDDDSFSSDLDINDMLIKTCFVHSSKLIRDTSTYFQGHVVPLDIFKKIQEVDGIDEWYGRGVEVSDRAWDVLLAWYKTVQDRKFTEV